MRAADRGDPFVVARRRRQPGARGGDDRLGDVAGDGVGADLVDDAFQIVGAGEITARMVGAERAPVRVALDLFRRRRQVRQVGGLP